jgi:hypothetical protein
MMDKSQSESARWRFRPFGIWHLATLAAVAWLTASAAAAGQAAALHIVVLDGEDAVNIVQQRTAVAPVVEVRDRNDQPVVGALVRFAIRSGRGSFGGARTLSVTTNGAGRAVAVGLTPSGPGALQIGATASFQGQTAAVTIAQTNVMTAAQAAAAATGAVAAGAGAAATTAAAGTAGAAGAAGAVAGGVSATTIGVIGAAVAGGAVAATKVAGGADTAGHVTKYTGAFSSQLTVSLVGGSPSACSYVNSNAGTLTLALSDPGSAVSGTATIQARWAVVSTTCGAVQLGPFFDSTIDNVDVLGSDANLTFTWQNTGTGANNVAVTHTYTFTGSRANGTVTGVLSYTYRGVGPGGTEAGSAQMPVTLQ